MSTLIDRFSGWFNSRNKRQRFLYLMAFCLVFLGLLWLSIRTIVLDARVYTNPAPKHIGQPSTYPLTPKKH